jgi:FMNH2-dependent dimethyl sulfone monooxygenase
LHHPGGPPGFLKVPDETTLSLADQRASTVYSSRQSRRKQRDQEGELQLEFGLWLPVYGGWLRATGFDTEPSITESIALAEGAERQGYSILYASENFLNCIHGPQHDVDDAWTLLAAIAARTQAIQLIGALKPGFRPPLVAAQMIATVDRISKGRVGVNVVSGWWKQEFARTRVGWLSHDDKYAFASAYLSEMELIWSGTGDATAPRRRLAGGLRPPIWVGGHSDAGIRFAQAHANVLFLNGMTPPEIVTMRRRVTAADLQSPAPQVAMSAFVILAETDEEATITRDALMGSARRDLIALYRSAMIEAGTSAWSELSDDELIDSNGGFATAMVGSPATILAKLEQYREAGVDSIILQFPDMLADAERFASLVLSQLADGRVDMPSS